MVGEAFAAFRVRRPRGRTIVRGWREAAALLSHEREVSLPRAARMAIWLGEVAAAAADLAELDATGFHGPAIEAERRTIQAGVAALESRVVDALILYREVLRSWRDLGLVGTRRCAVSTWRRTSSTTANRMSRPRRRPARDACPARGRSDRRQAGWGLIGDPGFSRAAGAESLMRTRSAS